MKSPIWAAALALCSATTAAAKGPADADTRRWWATTIELSSDRMEGRDTGSAGYDRAAAIVAKRFADAKLKPMGSDGGWLQPVMMRETSVDTAALSVGGRTLKFLHEFTVQPGDSMPAAINASLAYRGYCAAATLGDVRGKVVICHGVTRSGLPTRGEREVAIKAAGGIGVMTIADPGFTVEPPRWPYAYARAVVLANAPADKDPLLRMTLNADALGKVIGAGGPDAAALIASGSSGAAVPGFDLTDPLHLAFAISHRAIKSSNVIGILPGTDPALAGQAIVLSAHLDGYGRGTPVNGDGIYNGTLDDAAYVALLIRLAEQRAGKGFRRPVIFVALTGEEKGLLGSEALLADPAFPKGKVAANINLDQLRPIFPLDLMTVHALDDSTLGDDARAVAVGMGIDVQHDPEPERNLVRRSDQWNFMKAGIPATAFVFGYRPGSESERVYRQWYKTGYHKPQDDPAQRMNWKAAADFNRFFYALVARVADQDAAPAWKAGSKLRPAAR